MRRKKVIKIAVGAAIAILAIVALVFYATSGITRAADEFFVMARESDANSIHEKTSAEFRNATSAAELAAFLKANRFDQVAETSWSSRKVANDVGTLEGTVTLDDGSVVALTIRLVKEKDAWRILEIELSDAGLSGGSQPSANAAASAAAMANGDAFPEMVFLHSDAFLNAVQQDDYREFRKFWVEGVTRAQMVDLAATMVKNDGAAETLRGQRPVIEQIVPRQGGGILVKGHVEVVPWHYTFAHAYVHAGGDWKLVELGYILDKTS